MYRSFLYKITSRFNLYQINNNMNNNNNNKFRNIFGTIRFLSSKKNEPKITLTDDGQTIVCWHPPESFPYEHTMPYVEETSTSKSVLNIKTLEQGENINYKLPVDRMGMEQLQAITYTNKYYWKRRRYDGIQLEPKHPRKGV